MAGMPQRMQHRGAADFGAGNVFRRRSPGRRWKCDPRRAAGGRYTLERYALMKLLIAIPALNEEDSIASIIQRSLEARAHIIKNSAVTDVDITVVSDGSTDRTVERALKFKSQIKCIEF